MCTEEFLEYNLRSGERHMRQKELAGRAFCRFPYTKCRRDVSMTPGLCLSFAVSLCAIIPLASF